MFRGHKNDKTIRHYDNDLERAPLLTSGMFRRLCRIDAALRGQIRENIDSTNRVGGSRWLGSMDL